MLYKRLQTLTLSAFAQAKSQLNILGSNRVPENFENRFSC